MRFHFDERKSGRLRANPKRGVGFEEAQEVFSHPYYLDQRSDLPEQYRAIGWVGEQLYTVIFEVREDEEGELLPPCDSLEGHQTGAATLWGTLVNVGNQCRPKPSPALRTKGGMCHGFSPIAGA
jgi:uncharacterized DUF497 family protein